MTKATDKQIAFIKDIIAETGYPFDIENATKEEATKYISEHIDKYREITWDRNINDWALAHGYF